MFKKVIKKITALVLTAAIAVTSLAVTVFAAPSVTAKNGNITLYYYGDVRNDSCNFKDNINSNGFSSGILWIKNTTAKSSNENVVSVSNVFNKLYAEGVGTATITVTVKNSKTFSSKTESASTTFTVTVLPAYSVSVGNLTFNDPTSAAQTISPTLGNGFFNTSGIFKSTVVRYETRYTATSSDPSIVDISSDGLTYTPKSAGTATITLKATHLEIDRWTRDDIINSASTTFTVTVNAPLVNQYSVDLVIGKWCITNGNQAVSDIATITSATVNEGEYASFTDEAAVIALLGAHTFDNTTTPNEPFFYVNADAFHKYVLVDGAYIRDGETSYSLADIKAMPITGNMIFAIEKYYTSAKTAEFYVDGEKFGETQYVLNESEVVKTAVPDNYENETGRYSFESWMLRSNTEYIYDAQFSYEPAQLCIELDVNGASSYVEGFYGKAVSYFGTVEDPASYIVEGVEYTFTGWELEPVEISGPETNVGTTNKNGTQALYTSEAINNMTMTRNMTFTAVFSSEKLQYTVSFMADGVLYDSQTLEYGATPVFPSANPVKADDGIATYSFAGWSTAPLNANGIVKELPAISGENQTYYAIFYAYYDEEEPVPNEVVEIPDEETPVAETPATKPEVVEIDDEETAKDQTPAEETPAEETNAATGDTETTALAIALGTLATVICAASVFGGRKKLHD